MTDLIWELLAAILVGLGYAWSYNVKGRVFFPAVCGAVMSWMLYSACLRFSWGAGLAAFLSAVLVTLWAEIMSRVCKAPATIFLIIGVLPLVPGSGIYYTMQGIVREDRNFAWVKGLETTSIAMGITLGILVVTSCTRLFFYIKGQKKTGVIG